MSHDLVPELLERSMRGDMGSPVRVHREIDSTNEDALRWAADGAPHGALVVADHQSFGRGRRGRPWYSEPGQSVLFSLILRPAVVPSRLRLLPVAVGVACAEGIERLTGIAARVRWPNDVTIRGRKLAGILIETRFAGSLAECVVVGVGVNVAWQRGEPPAAIAPEATSIAAEVEISAAGRLPGRAPLLAGLVGAIEDVYGEWSRDDAWRALLTRATDRSDMLGDAVIVRWPDGSERPAIARRLLADGRLEVLLDGVAVALDAGEIARISPVKPGAPR